MAITETQILDALRAIRLPACRRAATSWAPGW